MVVTDLDHTLLSADKEISDDAVDIIDRLKKNDVKFTFITGRPPYAIKKFAEKVCMSAPIVGCNGALIVGQEKGQYISGITLDFPPLVNLLESSKKQNLTVLILAGGVEYALSETNWTQQRKEVGREIPIAELSFFLKEESIFKVNIIAEENKDAFSSLLPMIIELDDHYSISVYGNEGCEIVAKGVNKKTGLEKLCKLTDIRIDEVLAIGDDVNDIEMIKAAGFGVAVGNAKEQTKRVADYVCDNTYTKGFIEAIGKFVL